MSFSSVSVFYVLCVCCYVLLCWIWFFLFFKHKTAYEMRISDWSSDVCSSDLFAGRGDRRASRSSRGVQDPARVAGSVSTRAEEIGRASCRERVCQYV